MSSLEISKERKKRYLEKLEEADELVKDIESWHTGTEDLLEDKAMRKAVYKSFQEVMEVIADICTMFVSDSDKVIGDDSDNIEKASGELFSNDLERNLLEANGLRNRVVHDYNGFDDRIALNSIEKQVENLERFRREAKKWIENS